jgi:uncharacterized lipoprotein YddW (UPF0748 family)
MSDIYNGDAMLDRSCLACLLALTVLFAVPAPLAAQPAADKREIRALWVTRFDYKTAEDVEKIIDNAAGLHFNVILFQVRGNGTVFYPSKIEPWAFELTSDSPDTVGKDPGWDPLKVAIERAHSRGVELHAYVNVFPAWRAQKYPPADSGQLWWTRPDWFMCDAAGRRMIPRDRSLNPKVGDWYSFISPGVPEVQDYLAELFEELVTNYEIDGLHYDYIRYPREITEVEKGYEDRVKKMGNWSYDPVSLARFAKETGVAAPDLDPAKWAQWRADQITETVRKISERVRKIRPNLIISAAVMADPDDAKATKYQSYVEWMQKGYLDAAITMNYTPDNELFTKRSRMLLNQRPKRGWVVPGMGLNTDKVTQQIQITRNLRADGFAGFAYARLFDRDKNHAPRPLSQELLKGPMAQEAKVGWRD